MSSEYLNSPDTDSDKEGVGSGGGDKIASKKDGCNPSVFTASEAGGATSPALSEAEVLEACAALKLVGNEHFGKAEYEAALAKYSEAINLSKKAGLPKDPLLLLNRSATFLALKRYVPAMSDSAQVCDTDPDNWKAHWRRGLALMGMVQKKFRTKEAVEAFEKCLQCTTLPSNKKSEVSAELAKAQRRLQKQDDETPPADLSNCTPS